MSLINRYAFLPPAHRTRQMREALAGTKTRTARMGIVPGNNTLCTADDSAFSDYIYGESQLVEFYDTQTIVRGDLTVGATVTACNTASENYQTDSQLLTRWDSTYEKLIVPFFANGLANNSDVVTRSMRDTNVWIGKYGSLHHIEHFLGVNSREERSVNRSWIEFTHLGVDIFNQDGTAALDMDLIDIQHGIVVLRAQENGKDLIEAPIELGTVAQFPGLFRVGSGAGDADAHVSGNGAASNAWQEGRSLSKLLRPLLLQLADRSNDARPTHSWLEVHIPFGNKTNQQNDGTIDIYTDTGFALSASNAGTEVAAAAARQPNLQVRTTIVAKRTVME